MGVLIMRMKFFALVAMGATALSPIMSTAAFAVATETPEPQGPNGTTLDTMQAQCDILAAAHGSAWNGAVDQSSIQATLISGPTEFLPLDRNIDESSIEGYGTFTPSDTYISGDPYRIGGSVNMFGIQRASAATWSNSRYDYTADFNSTFSYAFNCNLTETVHVPVQGHYVVEPTDQGNEEAGQNSCNAFTALGPTWEHWGQDHAQCDFIVEEPAHDEEEARPDEIGTPVTEAQTDTLPGHEENGGPVEVTGDLFIGQVVVCISPSTTSKKGVPGAWRAQNGYGGEKCTTAYFNEGHWDHGSTESQGTYISVPAV